MKYIKQIYKANNVSDWLSVSQNQSLICGDSLAGSTNIRKAIRKSKIQFRLETP